MSDESRQVEDLLMLWYRYEKPYRPHLGAPRVSPSCRDYLPDAGEVHQDAEDRDDDLDRMKAEAVAGCIDELHYLLRAAIHVHMRNKTAKASVHKNPRIEDQHTAYQAAKAVLLPLLRKAGLIRDDEPENAQCSQSATY